MAPQIFRLSTENNTVTPIPGMPTFKEVDVDALMGEKINLAILETVQDEAKKDIEMGKKINPEHLNGDKLTEKLNKLMEESFAEIFVSLLGGFAVSDATYYMESDQKLFRWKQGATEWFDTGLIDESEPNFSSFDSPDDLASIGFVIAVSGSTVYVGKRNGHLFQSFDEGDTWNDVTTELPFSVTQFKAIAFAGPTLYAATDKGVTYSIDGIHWHTVADTESTPLVIEKIAVDGTMVYGATAQQIYQFKKNSKRWEQVTPEVPSNIMSLAVDGNTLYVGTSGRGVLRFTINESL